MKFGLSIFLITLLFVLPASAKGFDKDLTKENFSEKYNLAAKKLKITTRASPLSCRKPRMQKVHGGKDYMGMSCLTSTSFGGHLQFKITEDGEFKQISYSVSSSSKRKTVNARQIKEFAAFMSLVDPELTADQISSYIALYIRPGTFGKDFHQVYFVRNGLKYNGRLGTEIDFLVFASPATAKEAQLFNKRAAANKSKPIAKTVRKQPVVKLSARQEALIKKINVAKKVVLAGRTEANVLQRHGGLTKHSPIVKEAISIANAVESVANVLTNYVVIDVHIDRQSRSGRLSAQKTQEFKQKVDEHLPMVNDLLTTVAVPYSKFKAKTFNRHVKRLRRSSFQADMGAIRRVLLKK